MQWEGNPQRGGQSRIEQRVAEIESHIEFGRVGWWSFALLPKKMTAGTWVWLEWFYERELCHGVGDFRRWRGKTPQDIPDQHLGTGLFGQTPPQPWVKPVHKASDRENL